MASGKLSPRQKMINIMYLVFISMIAMQMSKEVLSAFGYMNEKLTDNNTTASVKNKATLENLGTKAAEQPEKYSELYTKAIEIDKLSSKFNDYLEEKKQFFLKDNDNKTDYETMDQAGIVDEHFFKGDKFTTEGQEI